MPVDFHMHTTANGSICHYMQNDSSTCSKADSQFSLKEAKGGEEKKKKKISFKRQYIKPERKKNMPLKITKFIIQRG